MLNRTIGFVGGGLALALPKSFDRVLTKWLTIGAKLKKTMIAVLTAVGHKRQKECPFQCALRHSLARYRCLLGTV